MYASIGEGGGGAGSKIDDIGGGKYGIDLNNND